MKKKNAVKCMALGASGLMGVSAFISAMPILAAEPSGADFADTFTTNGSGVAEAGNGTASITIQGNSGQTLKGKQFGVYMLFTAQNSANNESIRYDWNPAYKTAIQTVVAQRLTKAGTHTTPDQVTEDRAIWYINTLKEKKGSYPEGATSDQSLQSNQSAFRYFIQDLKNELVKEGVDGTCKVVVNGTTTNNAITIDGLQYGYYLIDELYTGVAESTAASLCMVNTANPDAAINIKSDYPTVDKKVTEDSTPGQLDNVSDYEIGQFVPYTISSAVPNVSGYKTYPMIFRDKMSKGLTLVKDSIEVKMVQGSKEVPLKQGTEWTFSDTGSGRTPGAAGSTNSTLLGTAASNNDLYTFDINILDAKALADQYFPNPDLPNKNDLNTNTYGQKIVITYKAILNDKAVVGNPGNPNTITLLFYNDPEWEGNGSPITETPDHTVVSFTYGMDNTKYNNHDQVLKGAEFLLYSDEACTKPVYVKKSTEADKPDGYIVINQDSITGTGAPADAVTMVSNATGKFNIYGLDKDDVYWLKEIKAPDGYRPLAGPIKFTVKATYTGNNEDMIDAPMDQQNGTANLPIHIGTLNVDATEKDFIDGLLNTGDVNLAIKDNDPGTGTGVLPVVNQVGVQLPITGTPLVLLGGAVTLALVGGGLVVMRKGRKED